MPTTEKDTAIDVDVGAGSTTWPRHDQSLSWPPWPTGAASDAPASGVASLVERVEQAQTNERSTPKPAERRIARQRTTNARDCQCRRQLRSRCRMLSAIGLRPEKPSSSAW